jgi:hypothetical protein
MFGCRPTSTSLGERIHMEQSLAANNHDVAKILARQVLAELLNFFF